MAALDVSETREPAPSMRPSRRQEGLNALSPPHPEITITAEELPILGFSESFSSFVILSGRMSFERQ